MRRGLTAIVLAALAVAAMFGWQQHKLATARADKDRAEMQAGIAASRTLSALFERTGDLRIATLRGTVVTETRASSGPFADIQRTRAPYSVSYFVDLRSIGPKQYRWDARHRVLFVEVPDVQAAPPAVDMARARVEQDGFWISRSAGQAMQQQAATNLSATARATARDAEHLRRAQYAARVGIAALFAAPLRAAGVAGVDVQVRLASDPRPGGYKPWDMSRSIEEVLADPRLKL